MQMFIMIHFGPPQFRNHLWMVLLQEVGGRHQEGARGQDQGRPEAGQHKDRLRAEPCYLNLTQLGILCFTYHTI